MDANQVSIPTPEANDPQDVQEALQAASTLWEQDPVEALRWLRKAAETASDAGDVMRSVHLARAAADLREQAQISGSLPPPASGPPPGAIPTPNAQSAPAALQAAVAVTAGHNPAQTVPATPAAAAAAALQEASHAAQAVGDVSQGNGAGHDPAAQQAAAAAQQAAAEQAAQQAAAQQAAAQQAAAEQAAQQASAQQQAELAAQQAAAQQAAAQQAAAEQQAALAAAQQQAAAAQPAPRQTAPMSSPPSAPHFVTHRSVRVALSPAPTGPGQFTVHPLAEGEAAEPGWTEALLVALAPGERLFPGRE